MAKSRSQVAPRSRAARRAASPSMDLDKSVTSLPRAESPSTQGPAVLADRANAGVMKKQKKKNDKVSRAQRLRQQKGMDRAEAVLDQLEIKKAKSFARARVVDGRRADWEETNRKASAFAALQNNDNDDEDEEGDDSMAEDAAPAKVPMAKNVFEMEDGEVDNNAANDATDDTAVLEEADEIT
ncbi:unnamed protein product [Penicillium salamii]|uniref:Ribosome biogenesis protein Alb1 n=1 Tax=Penicillium salamii TaxID=1612424 RepID=A0A9W4NEG1_9EURO|nr:unnamed protein product [Penicillium salamii]CAG8046822.1 unnamed protein product [Penicillium salamii]CAG8336383.1 unnamed protein product [Penicillium salamii]CAG8348352.1 unnamed protein product [Penicillium salamii]CAG8348417.1 unnamed protein product [Penicillium salamii]